MALRKIRLRNEISWRGDSRLRDYYLKIILVLVFFLWLVLIGSLDNVLHESLEENGVAGDRRRLFLYNVDRLSLLCLPFLTLDDDLALAVTIHHVLKLFHIIHLFLIIVDLS